MPKRVVTVPRYIRADEEPETHRTEWELEDAGFHVSDCGFRGQDGHRFADCPNRPRPYTTDDHHTRYA